MRFKTIAVATALSAVLWGASAGATVTAYKLVKKMPELTVIQTMASFVDGNVFSLHIAAHSLALTPSQLAIGDQS
jgi:peptidase E